METLRATCPLVNIVMTPEEEIEALKAAVGARTDMALAEKLGVGRSAVSKWKDRGGLPEKYRFLISNKPDEDAQDAMLIALRFQFFGESERGRWMLVASSVLPPQLFEHADGESDFERGKRIDRAYLRMMSLSLHVSKKHLKKEQLQDDNDCKLLIEKLTSEHDAEINHIVEIFGPNPRALF